jgi:hypothetical protein
MAVTLLDLAAHLGPERVLRLESEGHWPPSEFDLQVLTIPLADAGQHPNDTLASIMQAYVNQATK